jgi:hypothetical protein
MTQASAGDGAFRSTHAAKLSMIVRRNCRVVSLVSLPFESSSLAALPRVPSPENILGRFDDPPAGGLGGNEDVGHLGPSADVVCQGDTAKAAVEGHVRVVRQRLPAEQHFRTAEFAEGL